MPSITIWSIVSKKSDTLFEHNVNRHLSCDFAGIGTYLMEIPKNYNKMWFSLIETE